MTNINLAEAKTQLSALVERAERGERIGIMRRGKLVAELAPVTTPKIVPVMVSASANNTDTRNP